MISARSVSLLAPKHHHTRVAYIHILLNKHICVGTEALSLTLIAFVVFKLSWLQAGQNAVMCLSG